MNNYIENITGFTPYDFKDKERSVKNMMLYMLDRMSMMFAITGLPDTIPHNVLMRNLLTHGNVFVMKDGDDLVALTGGKADKNDVNYEPTRYTIANPYLKILPPKTYTIWKDGILVRCDDYEIGIIPILRKYCTAIIESELTLSMATKSLRAVFTISASTAREKASADIFISDLEDGKISSIAEQPFFDGIKMLSGLSGVSQNYATQLIELDRYFRSLLYNEIGLQMNHNMKRESINEAEANLDNDPLYPLVDNMLFNVRLGFDKVNEKFGTNIEVDLSSSWKHNHKEIQSTGKEESEVEDGTKIEDTKPSNT